MGGGQVAKLFFFSQKVQISMRGFTLQAESLGQLAICHEFSSQSGKELSSKLLLQGQVFRRLWENERMQ